MEKKSIINIDALKKGGVVKLKGKDMFSIWVKTSCCNLFSEQLKKIADISDKYGRGIVLLTTRQIPIIPFVELKNVEIVKEELKQVDVELDRCGSRVRNINVCYDDKVCPDALTNSLSLGEKLERYFYDSIGHKIKIGIAGCDKDCNISRVLNDICFIGTKDGGNKGYDVYLGGRLGLKPFVGIKMADNLSEDTCIRFVQNYFDFLRNEGKTGERSADIINRFGAENVRKALNKDLGRVLPEEIFKCETKTKETDKNRAGILKIKAVCGEVTSNQLRKIAEISKIYGRDFVHFTVRGSLEIPWVDEEKYPEIRKVFATKNLEILEGGIDNIQTCFGDYCTNTACDTQSVLKQIDWKCITLGINNFDIKISGAGCPNSCGIAHLSDIGLLGIVEPAVDKKKCNGCSICVAACRKKTIRIEGNLAIIDKKECSFCGDCIRACPVDAIGEKKKGFALLVGAKGGKDTRLGISIATFLSEEEVLVITEKILSIIKEKNAKISDIIDDIGMDKFKELIGVK